jgi:integrase
LDKYLEKQWNTYHASMKVPKDVQAIFGKTKFHKTLGTDSLEEANIRKLPLIAEWKRRIKVARLTKKDHPTPSIDEQVAFYKAEIETKWKGFEQDGLGLLADVLDENYYRDHRRQLRTDTTKEEKAGAEEILNRVAGDWSATHEHIEDFIADAEYTLKTSDEARSSLKQFTDKFRVFELIAEEDIAKWVEELLATQARPTVKKKISFARNYWAFCKKRGHTSANYSAVLTPEIWPKERRTKSATAKKINSARMAWAVSDYHRLLKAKPDDEVLCNLITLAAYTGCRREELCAMKLTEVSHDRFLIKDAKTEAGRREIPIHSEIKQFVAMLVNTSDDGYLLSGLTDNNKYNSRGAAVGKRFLRLRDKLGYNHQYVLHSFRKTLITQMKAAGVPEVHAAQIVGHEIETISYGLYGDDIGFPAKVTAMETCSYKE